MRFAQAKGMRRVCTCCLVAVLSALSQQWLKASELADGESRVESGGEKHNSGDSPVQTKRSETGTRAEKRRISLRIELAANAGSEKPKRVVTFPVLRRVTVEFLADAIEVTEFVRRAEAGLDDARIVKLKKDVQLRLNDETVSASGNQAVLTFEYQKDSKATVKSVKMSLSGDVRWTSGGLKATAKELTVTLEPDGNGVFRVADFNLKGRAHLDGARFLGIADDINVTHYPTHEFPDEAPFRLVLDGNATLYSETGILGGPGKSKTQGRHIEFVPNWNKIQVDQLKTIKAVRSTTSSGRSR